MSELDLGQQVESLAEASASGDGAHVLTANLDIFAQLRRLGSSAQNLVGSWSVVVADGMPIVLAGRASGQSIPGRVTGADLLPALLERFRRDGLRVHLSGGGHEVAEMVARRWALPPGSTSAFMLPGREDPAHRAAAEVIAAGLPDLVLLGYGFPKQDLLAVEVRRLAPHAVVIGCGAALDFAAGRHRRAPGLIQRIGAEWVYRLWREPRRMVRRYLVEDMAALAPLIVTAMRIRRERRSRRTLR